MIFLKIRLKEIQCYYFNKIVHKDMRFYYCMKCNTKECEYKEVEEFINYINKESNSEYHCATCPDKDPKKEYSCDLCFEYKEKSIYVEVKRAFLGVGNVDKNNSYLGERGGQEKCVEVIQKIVNDNSIANSIQSDVIDIIKDCCINIPLVKLSNNNKDEFEKQLLEFLKKLDVNNKEHIFEFKNKRGKFNISFRRIEPDIYEKFGPYYKGPLFEYGLEDENTLNNIYSRLTDVSGLCDRICKNFNETSEKKFPKDADQKILLNILELLPEYHIFLNKELEEFFEKVYFELTHRKIETNATEGYLLYYTNDFWDGEAFKRKLVILPILGKSWVKRMVILDCI